MSLNLPSIDGCGGIQTYTVLPVCTCSHGAHFHELVKGVRKSCSAWKCGCMVYQARSDTDG